MRSVLERMSAVGAPPACVLVELPMRELGCAAVPWEELVAMRAAADAFDVRLHCDGARLFEIAPHYGRTMAEVLDSREPRTRGVTLATHAWPSTLGPSLVGGFLVRLRLRVILQGARRANRYSRPTHQLLASRTRVRAKRSVLFAGAMLLGDASFIEASRPWRRRLGGNPFTVLPYAVSARGAYRAHVGSFSRRRDKMRAFAALLSGAHPDQLRFEPAEPHCCQCHCYLR